MLHFLNDHQSFCNDHHSSQSSGNTTVMLRQFAIFKLQRKLNKNIRACTKCENLSSGYTFYSSEDPIAKLETVIGFNNRYFQLCDCHSQLLLALWLEIMVVMANNDSYSLVIQAFLCPFLPVFG